MRDASSHSTIGPVQWAATLVHYWLGEYCLFYCSHFLQCPGFSWQIPHPSPDQFLDPASFLHFTNCCPWWQNSR